MSEDDVLFGYRLRVLEHAARTSVSEACRVFGIHRSTYYVWKRRAEDGGGVLRFYGVQLIALLAQRGYNTVLESTTAGAIVTEPERWRAQFVGPGLPPCALSVDSRAQRTGFRVVVDAPSGHRVLVDRHSPFSVGGGSVNADDSRVPALIALLGSLDDDDSKWLSFYGTVNDLWSRVEAETSSLVVC
jgi:hypothetical protein